MFPNPSKLLSSSCLHECRLNHCKEEVSDGSATPASSHVAAVSCGCCRPFGREVAEAFNSCFTSTVRLLQQSDVHRTRNDMSDETSCAITPTTFQQPSNCSRWPGASHTSLAHTGKASIGNRWSIISYLMQMVGERARVCVCVCLPSGLRTGAVPSTAEGRWRPVKIWPSFRLRFPLAISVSRKCFSRDTK